MVCTNACFRHKVTSEIIIWIVKGSLHMHAALSRAFQLFCVKRNLKFFFFFFRSLYLRALEGLTPAITRVRQTCGRFVFDWQLHVSRLSDVTMLVKEEAPVKDAKGRKTVRPKRDEEVCGCVY